MIVVMIVVMVVSFGFLGLGFFREDEKGHVDGIPLVSHIGFDGVLLVEAPDGSVKRKP